MGFSDWVMKPGPSRQALTWGYKKYKTTTFYLKYSDLARNNKYVKLVNNFFDFFLKVYLQYVIFIVFHSFFLIVLGLKELL